MEHLDDEDTVDALEDMNAALPTPTGGAAAGMTARREVALQWRHVSMEQQRASGEFAISLGKRRREAGAPVRTVFVSDEHVAKPTLARLLSSEGGPGGGGRGGQLRAKLYLSLLWVCAKQPYDVARPARAWAALLGLPDIETKGVRRVQQALRDLEDRQLVRLQDRGGLPSNVVLLSEKGDQSPYAPPSDVYSRLQANKASSDQLAEHRYFRVPSTLWTKGYIADLTGPGLAMLLALMSERRGQTDPGIWISPARATNRFGFASSTRTDGLTNLRQAGLLTTTRKVVSESGSYIDFARRRSVHEIVEL